MAVKTVLVCGGAGEVGEGIVRQLLAEGNQVLVQSRTEAKLTELAQRLGAPAEMKTIVGDVSSEAAASALRSAIKDGGFELHAVVASIGSWWSGPALIDLDVRTYQQVMDDRLTVHFIVAKTFLPLLADRPGSSYVFIHGASGFFPIANSGPVSIAGAAQVMLKDVFAKELESKAVRINLLSMMGAIATRSHPTADPESLTADDVGQFVAYLVSDRSSERGETIKYSHRRQLHNLNPS